MKKTQTAKLLLALALLLNGTAAPSAAPTGSSQEQELQFRNYGIDAGLSHSKVNCFLQDRQGFIWCGTNEGLNRFDGYAFTSFQHEPGNPHSLSANLIRCMVQDRQNYIWIGSQNGGLCRFDPRTQTFERVGDENAAARLSGANINAMALESSDALWLGTEHGLEWLSPDRRQVRYFRPAAGAGRQAASASHLTASEIMSPPLPWEILALHLDRQGVLWIGTLNQGLFSFDPSTEDFTAHPHSALSSRPAGGDEIHAIHQDLEGTLWIGTAYGGLRRMEPAGGPITILYPGAGNPESTTIRAILDDGQGSLWIGNRSGLYRLDRRSGEFTLHTHDPNNNHSLVQNSVQAIFQDRKGDLWIGTRGGISFLNTTNIPFHHYRADAASHRGLNTQEVYAIMEDRRGDLWFGTESGGLNHLDRRSGRFTYHTFESGNPNSLSVNNIKALLEDRQGNLWIGTFNGGLNLLPAGRKRSFSHYLHQPHQPHSLASDNILGLLEMESGDIWIGTNGGGLDRFDRRSGRFHHLLTAWHGEGFSSIFAMLQDRHGRLWVGGRQARLGCLEPRSGAFCIIQLDAAGNDIEVRALLQDRSGRIWIGTIGAGLFALDPQSDSLSHFTTREGLPSNIVCALLEDDAGMLWMSTSNGLCRFDPATHRSKCYYKENGLQSNQFNYGAALRTRRGEFFFGGINGATAFFPGAIHENTFVPPVVITNLTIFNQPVPIAAGSVLAQHISQTSSIDLSYRHAVFSFEFAALNFANSEQNQYAYIMEGFEKAWNYAGVRRFATYTNLDPGSYTFRVKAANNDGLWNEPGVSLRISISRPFWRTRWFILLLLALTLALIKGFIDFIRQRRDLLEARSLASLSQLKLLRYQMNPHFLFNALGSIRSMILISQEQAWDMVSALSEFLRYALLNFNKVEALLDDELTAVTNYLNIEKVRYRDSLQVAVNIDEQARKLVVPAFICQPLVENAIKYGMQTSPLPLQVILTISLQREELFIDVSNSGRLKPDTGSPGSSGDGHGNSIANIRQRLEIMFREEQSFDLSEEEGWVHARIRIKSPELNRRLQEEGRVE